LYSCVPNRLIRISATMNDVADGADGRRDVVHFVDDDDDEEEDEDQSQEEEEEEEESDDDDDEDLSDVSSGEDDEDVEQYLTLDMYDEANLPEYACRYCGIYDPACVAKCVESGKWFCNSSSGNSSHIIHHLVRTRTNCVQLHPESPLGDTLLECYNCASRNVFVLGFVPASASSIVVLLCRVCVETVPALKDMEWELSQWHPLIQDRKFLPWLIKEPNQKLLLRAREINNPLLTALEEMWKTKPEATYADLQHRGENGDDGEELEVQPTLREYEDGFHYQNILAPLVKMEADYDRQMKENMTEESISVRWDKSLSGKHVASFTFHRNMEQSRMVVGDELRIKLGHGAVFLNGGNPWEGHGYVKNIIDGEIELELTKTSSHGTVPEQISDDYAVEYVWKSTSYDRMQNALKQFAIDDTSVTGYIYHKLLGHPVADQAITSAKIPKDFSVPGLPPLNESQLEAVAAVLQKPLSLIQGPVRAATSETVSLR